MLKIIITFVVAMALSFNTAFAANIDGNKNVNEMEVAAGFSKSDCLYSNGTDFYYDIERGLKGKPLHLMFVYEEAMCPQEIWIELSEELKVANTLTYEQAEDENGKRLVYIYQQQ